jgi:hypothetical protein
MTVGIRGGAAKLAAASAVAFIPLWWHVAVVNRGVSGIIAVFSEVGVYPSDVCLAVLALVAIGYRGSMSAAWRWLGIGLASLVLAVVVSAREALDARLAAGLAVHLGILTLAYLGVRGGNVSRTTLAAALVGSATVQAVLAAGQFVIQQPLIPALLHLPWLPTEAAAAGTPVVLDAAGERLLRGFGTFPHPNVLGGYLAMALVSLPVLGQRWPERKTVWYCVGGVLGIGLLACFSRAGWLAALVGLGFWWCSGERHRRDVVSFAAMTAVACTAIGVSPLGSTFEARLFPLGPESNALERGSIEHRLALDRESLVAIVDHLPFGVGGGNYGLVAIADGRDDGWGEPAPNVALLVITELGVPGVLALALIVFGTLRALRQQGRFDTAATVACLALVVLSLVDHYLWTMPLGRVIAWLPLALTASVSQPQTTCRSNPSRVRCRATWGGVGG